jgi:hypothetical protein
MTLGLVASVLGIWAASRWPAAQPTYIDPVNRPRPITRRGQIAFIAGAGFSALLLGFMAFRMQWPSPLGKLVSCYFAGVMAGVAIALLLSADKMLRDQNRWLASMDPKSDTDQ